MNCFRAWEDTAIYSSDFLIKLQNVFLGLFAPNDKQINNAKMEQTKTLSDDIDGVPIIDPDLDGEEMILEESTVNAQSYAGKFKPSKWETIDPELVESKATASKWEQFDKSAAIFVDDDDDIDGKPMDEPDYFESLADTRKESKPVENALSTQQQKQILSREVLREIELKVVKYQDDLEVNVRSGRLKINPTETIAQMVEKYRKELLKKASSQEPSSSRTHSFSSSQSRRSRSRSPKSRHSSHYSKRFTSPPRRSRSRSPSSKRRK